MLILHVFDEPLRYDLIRPNNGALICFILLDFRQLGLFANLDILRPNTFGEKTNRVVRPRDGHIHRRTRVTFLGLSLEKRRGHWTFLPKSA